MDANLFADLKAKAMAQAKSLAPILLHKAVSFLKKVPTKAPGLDGWTCEILQNLQQPAVQAFLDFLHHCEREASWPDQMVFALIALLPKSEKRERPIALLRIYIGPGLGCDGSLCRTGNSHTPSGQAGTKQFR